MIETHIVRVLEDRAQEPGHGTYSFTTPGREQRTIYGAYVNIWKPQPDGLWKLFADLSLQEAVQ